MYDYDSTPHTNSIDIGFSKLQPIDTSQSLEQYSINIDLLNINRPI